MDTGPRRRHDDSADPSSPQQSLKRVRLSDGHDRQLPGHRDGTRALEYHKYTVGWTCALPLEMASARAMLDEIHVGLPARSGDDNQYILGRIGSHNVVITCLPAGGYGTVNAATVAAHMNSTFPSLRYRLIVGIGGGVPVNDLRLGDVVISTEIAQYDIGKRVQGGEFRRKGVPRKPPYNMRTAVSKYEAINRTRKSIIPDIISEMRQKYPSMSQITNPGPDHDMLFETAYEHDEKIRDCVDCDPSRLISRPPRESGDAKVHYGIIASGNELMRHGLTRDRIAEDCGAICFEMEAAGLMAAHPWLVIRGISDYADSHKNDGWQDFAAITAAACAKELLMMMNDSDALSGYYSPKEMRYAMLQSLKFESINSRESTIRKAHEETCKWILQHPKFLEWIDPATVSDHGGFFWIKGKPGAGKSTLMKWTANRTKAHATPKDIILTFFFNARGDELDRSVTGMYRSLILQLLSQETDLQSVLDDPKIAPRIIEGEQWTSGTLRDLLSRTISRARQRPIKVFIDALDECEDDEVLELIDFFQDVGDQSLSMDARVLICFSSRHYPIITIRRGLELILEDQIDHAHDLEKYVHSKLRPGKTKAGEKVRAQIIAKSSGVFLWVVLVVEILKEDFKNGRIFAVEKRLKEIPPTLSELLKTVLTRDTKNLDDLLLCIQWILFAKRPLKREEFYLAVASGLDAEQTEFDPEEVTEEDMENFVLSSSKGLAEVTRSKSATVQFIHESVRDFLLKEKGVQQIWPNMGHDFVSLSHEALKMSCNKYLCSDGIPYRRNDSEHRGSRSEEAKLRRITSRRRPLLNYAFEHLFEHAEGAAKGIHQGEFLNRFDLQRWIFFHNLFQTNDSYRYDVNNPLFFIICSKGLTALVDTLLQLGKFVSFTKPPSLQPMFFQYALIEAARKGNSGVVTLLSNNGFEYRTVCDLADFLSSEHDQASSSKVMQELLNDAVALNLKELARCLIDANVDINAKVGRAMPTFHMAIRNENIEIVRLLISAGADLQLSFRGQTPLQHALNIGQLDTAILLLDESLLANIAIPDDIYDSILKAAVAQDRGDIIRAFFGVLKRTTQRYPLLDLHEAALEAMRFNQKEALQSLLDGADSQRLNVDLDPQSLFSFGLHYRDSRLAAAEFILDKTNSSESAVNLGFSFDFFHVLQIVAISRPAQDILRFFNGADVNGWNYTSDPIRLLTIAASLPNHENLEMIFHQAANLVRGPEEIGLVLQKAIDEDSPLSNIQMVIDLAQKHISPSLIYLPQLIRSNLDDIWLTKASLIRAGEANSDADLDVLKILQHSMKFVACQDCDASILESLIAKVDFSEPQCTRIIHELLFSAASIGCVSSVLVVSQKMGTLGLEADIPFTEILRFALPFGVLVRFVLTKARQLKRTSAIDFQFLLEKAYAGSSTHHCWHISAFTLLKEAEVDGRLSGIDFQQLMMRNLDSAHVSMNIIRQADNWGRGNMLDLQKLIIKAVIVSNTETMDLLLMRAKLRGLMHSIDAKKIIMDVATGGDGHVINIILERLDSHNLTSSLHFGDILDSLPSSVDNLVAETLRRRAASQTAVINYRPPAPTRECIYSEKESPSGEEPIPEQASENGSERDLSSEQYRIGSEGR